MTALPTVDQDVPIRLSDILPIAFPYGGMTSNGLRLEAARGNLTIMRIAGKDFTTLANIEEMKRKCRVSENPQGYGSGRKQTIGRLSGSSSTEESKSAQVALQMLAERLKGNLPNISPTASRKSQRANTGMHPK